MNSLGVWEIPRALVEQSLSACRWMNTACDTAFYDVNRFAWHEWVNGRIVATDSESAAMTNASSRFHLLDLSAHSDPEGVILVVNPDSTTEIQEFVDVTKFIEAFPASTIAITGVGSSALGSAAFAWNISQAFGEPVAAIVPGFGLADVLPQAMSGWFGFGMHDFLRQWSHHSVAFFAPRLASIGRKLSSSAPNAQFIHNAEGVPKFRTGSPESDILHDILLSKKITRIVGHSKGALAIANALRSLPPQNTKDLEVYTFGCAIARNGNGTIFYQLMGILDGLGMLNSWFHLPDHWLVTHHSTNRIIPLGMDVPHLLETPSRANRDWYSKGNVASMAVV